MNPNKVKLVRQLLKFQSHTNSSKKQIHYTKKQDKELKVDNCIKLDNPLEIMVASLLIFQEIIQRMDYK